MSGEREHLEVPKNFSKSAHHAMSSAIIPPMPMDDHRAEAHRRVTQHFRDLEERLDASAFALLLKVISGVNTAFAQRNQSVDIDLTREERNLFTGGLQEELVILLKMLDFSGDRIEIATAGVTRGERDRREVEAIARASGMEP